MIDPHYLAVAIPHLDPTVTTVDVGSADGVKDIEDAYTAGALARALPADTDAIRRKALEAAETAAVRDALWWYAEGMKEPL